MSLHPGTRPHRAPRQASAALAGCAQRPTDRLVLTIDAAISRRRGPGFPSWERERGGGIVQELPMHSLSVADVVDGA